MSQSITAKELKSLQNSQWRRNNERELKKDKEAKESRRVSHIQSTKTLNKVTSQICADVEAMETNGITLELLLQLKAQRFPQKVA